MSSSSTTNKRKAPTATGVADDLLSLAAAMRRPGMRDYLMQHLTAEQVKAMDAQMSQFKSILSDAPVPTDEPKSKQPKLGANTSDKERYQKIIDEASRPLAPLCGCMHSPHPRLESKNRSDRFPPFSLPSRP